MTKNLVDALQSRQTREQFEKLYGRKPAALKKQVSRYKDLIGRFTSTFGGQRAVELFSTPGRTEVGGNHTDHNAGRVLAAAINLDIIAAVAKNDDNTIRIHSEGYSPFEIALAELDPVKSEICTAPSLTRGVSARMKQLGYAIGGFDACVSGQVPKGSGLSSSAAFEVLMVTILDHLYNDDKIDTIVNAQMAQYAENHYFGKPCGLMDQTTCAVGGFVTIDFKDFANPIVKKVDFDFSSSGYSLVIVDTGGNHADLTEDYTALENEMKAVAGALGGKVLREFTPEDVFNNIAALRGKVGDRAILRAIHFHGDNQRVVDQVNALERGDVAEFLRLVTESGRSSWMLCQNCYSHKNINQQGISIALAISEEILRGKGAWRVHGGGFAGTIQAFVPDRLLGEYIGAMQEVFGPESCHELSVRPVGSTVISIS
jgi:galactokinase